MTELTTFVQCHTLTPEGRERVYRMANHHSVDQDVIDAFAHALKGARESRRLTQEAFSELCDVSAETLQRYERPAWTSRKRSNA